MSAEKLYLLQPDDLGYKPVNTPEAGATATDLGYFAADVEARDPLVGEGVFGALGSISTDPAHLIIDYFRHC